MRLGHLGVLDEYKRHTELAESDRLDADDRDYLNRMIKGTLRACLKNK